MVCIMLVLDANHVIVKIQYFLGLKTDVTCFVTHRRNPVWKVICKQRCDTFPTLDDRCSFAAFCQWFDIDYLVGRAVDHKLGGERVEGRVRANLWCLTEEFLLLSNPRREDWVVRPNILDCGHCIVILLLFYSLRFGLFSYRGDRLLPFRDLTGMEQ